MAAKLFVGNLSYQATEDDIRELFQQTGTVESVRIITDQFTGRPKGYAFVEMSTPEEAAQAIEQLNGRVFLLGGSKPTVADFCVAALLAYAAPAKMPVEQFGNVVAWMRRLDEVPAWAATAHEMG